MPNFNASVNLSQSIPPGTGVQFYKSFITAKLWAQFFDFRISTLFPDNQIFHYDYLCMPVYENVKTVKRRRKLARWAFRPTRGSGRMKPSSSQTWYGSREKGALKSVEAAAIEKITETHRQQSFSDCLNASRDPNLRGLRHRVHFKAAVNNGHCLHNICPLLLLHK